MRQYVIKRLLLMIPTLFGVALLVFFLLRVAPGDIVGAGRTKGMTFEQAQALFDKKTDYESHSDIVVEVRGGEADLIGGNVSDSVTKKTLKLDAKGRLRDKKNLSFVVMKKN